MNINVFGKTAVACALALFAGAPLVNAAAAEAATVVSIGATASWDNTPVMGPQGWPYNGNAWYPDPDGVITDTKVVRYPASLGIPPFMPMGQSVSIGARGAVNTIATTDGKILALCLSQGCLSLEEALKILKEHPELAPAVSDFKLVMLGSPSAENGFAVHNAGKTIPFIRITFPEQLEESPYEILYVSKEFDFFADNPGKFGVVSALNSIFGLITHIDYTNVDMDDPDNLIKTVGTRTYMIIPTKRLPLLIPLYAAGDAVKFLTGSDIVLKIAEALDGPLRHLVNQDFTREGYVPLGSYVPPEAVNEVPASAQASLRGSLPEESYTPSTFSLDVTSNDSNALDATDVSSKDDSVVVTDAAQQPEKVETPTEPVTPVITPEVSNEQKPVVETPLEQKPVEAPPVQNSPQGDANENAQESADTKQPDAEKPKAAESDEAPKPTLKKSGEGVKKTVVQSHRTPKVNSTTTSDDDNSSSASASNSPSSNNGGASTDSGAAND